MTASVSPLPAVECLRRGYLDQNEGGGPHIEPDRGQHAIRHGERAASRMRDTFTLGGHRLPSLYRKRNVAAAVLMIPYASASFWHKYPGGVAQATGAAPPATPAASTTGDHRA